MFEAEIVNEGIVDGLMKEFFFSTEKNDITNAFYTKFDYESSLEKDFDHTNFSNAKLLKFFKNDDGYKFEFNPAINLTNHSLLKLYLILEYSEFFEKNFDKIEFFK